MYFGFATLSILALQVHLSSRSSYYDLCCILLLSLQINATYSISCEQFCFIAKFLCALLYFTLDYKVNDNYGILPLFLMIFSFQVDLYLIAIERLHPNVAYLLLMM